MNKLKSCMNKDYCQNQYCPLRGDCTDTDNSNCELYTSKPKESAWEMAGELYNTLTAELGGVKNGQDYERLHNLMAQIPEPCTWEEDEAIEIMTKIKGELNES